MMPNEKETDVNHEITSHGDDHDKLSDLPDAVLVTILSLLTPREAVRTCVLSKTWRNLWRFVPSFKFSHHDFRRDTGFVVDDYLEIFENFVSSFLRFRDDATDVQTFWLLHHPSPSRLPWIRYVFLHRPKIVRIDIYDHGSVDLPDCLFFCETLVKLVLNLKTFAPQFEMNVPDKVFFPKLKKLELNSVIIKGDSMERLLSGCSALESVKLIECELIMNSVLFRTVKQLQIIYCYLDLPSFSIFAPRLEYIKLEGNFGSSFVKFRDIFRVKKTIIIDDVYTPLDACEFLSNFSHIEDLQIRCDLYAFKEALQGKILNFTAFSNLKKLFLEQNCVLCDFDVLSSFLEHCPNLERLKVFHTRKWCHGRHQNLEKVGKFSCGRLRLIEVGLADDDADQIVRFFVESKRKKNDVQITVLKESKFNTHILFEKVISRRFLVEAEKFGCDRPFLNANFSLLGCF